MLNAFTGADACHCWHHLYFDLLQIGLGSFLCCYMCVGPVFKLSLKTLAGQDLLAEQHLQHVALSLCR